MTVDLDWTDNPEPEVTGYDVHRSTSSGFTPTVATRVAEAVTQSAFTDVGLEESRTYYYRVIAVGSLNNASVPSLEAMAITPADTAVPTISEIITPTLDTVTVVALNDFLPPQELYAEVYEEDDSVIVIENKIGYTKRTGSGMNGNFRYEKSGTKYPIIRIGPKVGSADFTIVTYGGMAGILNESLEALFVELDLKPEMIVLPKIYPIDDSEYEVISESVRRTGGRCPSRRRPRCAGFRASPRSGAGTACEGWP